MIDTGAEHTVAIKTDGSLWAWGHNALGQLGDGTSINRTVPTRIGTDADWIGIGTGWVHTVGMRSL